MRNWLAAQQEVADAVESVLERLADARALSVDQLAEEALSTLASRVPAHARPYVERAKTVHDVLALLEEAWEGVESFKELLARGLAAQAALSRLPGAEFKPARASARARPTRWPPSCGCSS